MCTDNRQRIKLTPQSGQRTPHGRGSADDNGEPRQESVNIRRIPLNPMPNGTCRTIKAQYGNTSAANFINEGGVRFQPRE